MYFHKKKSYNKKIRDDSPQYKEWWLKVMRRDKFKCQMPKCRKRAKQVHHVIRYVDSHSLRWEPSNGISLCKECHKEVTKREHLYIKLFSDIISRKK